MTSDKRNNQKLKYQVLLIVAAGVLCLYAFAAYPFYTHQKKQIMERAWRILENMELYSMDEDDEEILQSFELEKLEFVIADEEFDLVYATKEREADRLVENYVISHLDSYQTTPQITQKQYQELRVLRMRGILTQQGKDYYIYIRKEIFAAAEIIQLSILYFTFGMLLLGAVSVLLERREQRREQLLYLEEGQGKEKLAQVQKEFVANVSHELKTPLAVISGQVEMLQSMGDKIDRDYYFASIREEIDKMSDLVGDLLDITIVEHSMEKMELSPVNLSDMMDYMMLKYDALFRKNKVKVRSDVETGLEVLGNSMYLEQAVNNYIMNAFQHTGQGKKMAISLKKEKGFARIGVYNEGPHISEKDMEHIWQSFYANSKAKLKKEQKMSNAGLGLYLVKKIVVQHNGECGVENREDGVEFWIRLPLMR